jgi:acyl dehydratase
MSTPLDAPPLRAKADRYVPLAEMRGLVGEETGVSDWLAVGQDRIDAFADLCGDHQFIHVDPARAAATPMGGTVAHGFLTLSLLSYLAAGARPRIEGTRHSVNYGFDRVRFVAPVPAGARIRARFRLAALEEARAGEVSLAWDVAVEVEGAEIAAGGRPAVAARWLTRSYLEG